MGGLIIGLITQWAPLLGHDWFLIFFQNRETDIYYPPWTSILLWPLAELPWRLGLALINGITISAVSISTYYEGRGQVRGWRFVATLLALFSIQTIVVLWTGHIDGLAMLGILALPWSAPLVLMKSTFIGFVVFTRKTWLFAALAFGLLSLVIWPFWPIRLVDTLVYRNTSTVSAGWAKTGWLPVLIGMFLFLKSRRSDIFQTMAAGALMYPFLLPYHFIILLAALGALKGLRLLIAWLAAWVMVVPVAIGNYFFLYYLFPIVIWLFRHEVAHYGETYLDLIKKPIRVLVSKKPS